jgi:hypothetical protein
MFICKPTTPPQPPNPGLFAKNKQRQGDDVNNYFLYKRQTSLITEQKGSA